jgi:hypothetical protein
MEGHTRKMSSRIINNSLFLTYMCTNNYLKEVRVWDYLTQKGEGQSQGQVLIINLIYCSAFSIDTEYIMNVLHPLLYM